MHSVVGFLVLECGAYSVDFRCIEFGVYRGLWTISGIVATPFLYV